MRDFAQFKFIYDILILMKYKTGGNMTLVKSTQSNGSNLKQYLELALINLDYDYLKI